MEKRKGAPLLIWETASQLEKFGKVSGTAAPDEERGGGLVRSMKSPPTPPPSSDLPLFLEGGVLGTAVSDADDRKEAEKSRIWHQKMAPMSSPLSDIPLHLVPRGGEKRIATTRQNFLEIVPFYSPSPQFPDLHKRF